MERKCKDCDDTTYSPNSPRCFKCKLKHIKLVQIATQVKQSNYRRDYNKKPKHRYSIYEKAALRRGMEFDISYDQFIEYWDNQCHYCGQPIKGIGLDRIDNKKGYTLDNIVVCCKTCNWMKHTLLNDVFIKQCKLIAIKHSLNNP